MLIRIVVAVLALEIFVPDKVPTILILIEIELLYLVLLILSLYLAAAGLS